MTKLILKRAADSDCRDLWRWRNYPEIRKNFFNQSSVSWKDHKKWFYSRFKDRNARIYIASIEEEKVGVVRFEIEKYIIRISVNLNPDFFGRNLGTKIIKLGTEKIFNEENKRLPIIAEVKKDNIASQKAFLKAGYEHAKETADKVVYKKEVNNV